MERAELAPAKHHRATLARRAWDDRMGDTGKALELNAEDLAFIPLGYSDVPLAGSPFDPNRRERDVDQACPVCGSSRPGS